MLSTPEVAAATLRLITSGLTGQVFDIKRHDSRRRPTERRRTRRAAPLALSRLEYRLASPVLRLVGLLATLLPIRATGSSWRPPGTPLLEGNLLALHDAIRPTAARTCEVTLAAGALLATG